MTILTALKSTSSDPSLITAAIDVAITKKDVSDVQAACSYASGGNANGEYIGTFLKMLHDHVGDRFAGEGEEMALIALAAKEGYADYLTIEKGDLHAAVAVLHPLVNPKAQGSVSDAVMVRASVKLIELFCFSSEFIQAEALAPKCVNYLRYDCDDGELKVRFLCTQAQVHEFKRRFTEAAQRFYEVSEKDPNQDQEALKRAAICAILAEPTDGRARIVSTIANDDRSKGALGDLFPIISKINQMRFLRPQDIDTIKRSVVNETQIQGSPSVLDNAALVHNVKSVSQVYYNISLVELASLVGVTADVALRVAAHMIADGRINGTIDQVEDLITFHSSRDDACNRADAQIAVACNTVAQLYETIKLAHPTLAA